MFQGTSEDRGEKLATQGHAELHLFGLYLPIDGNIHRALHTQHGKLIFSVLNPRKSH